jgi:hypothetical protein
VEDVGELGILADEVLDGAGLAALTGTKKALNLAVRRTHGRRRKKKRGAPTLLVGDVNTFSKNEIAQVNKGQGS